MFRCPCATKGRAADPHGYASFVRLGRIGQPDEIANAVVWLCLTKPILSPVTPADRRWRSVRRSDRPDIRTALSHPVKCREASKAAGHCRCCKDYRRCAGGTRSTAIRLA